jgi:2-aminomuconate deaminase
MVNKIGCIQQYNLILEMENAFLFFNHKTMTTDPSSIHSGKAPEPVGLYPHARKVGNLLFLSGVGPREKGTKVIPGVTLDENGKIVAYDIEKQVRSVFNNVKLILEDSGSKWEDIVDVTVFLTNMKDDFPTYNKLWAEYFANNPPCRTTLEINCLPTPIAIELKVIAQLNG